MYSSVLQYCVQYVAHVCTHIKLHMRMGHIISKPGAKCSSLFSISMNRHVYHMKHTHVVLQSKLAFSVVRCQNACVVKLCIQYILYACMCIHTCSMYMYHMYTYILVTTHILYTCKIHVCTPCVVKFNTSENCSKLLCICYIYFLFTITVNVVHVYCCRVLYNVKI